MKKIGSLIVAVILIIVLVLGIKHWLPTEKPTQGTQSTVIPVKVTLAVKRNIHPQLSATGRLIYQQQTSLVTKQAGYLTHIYFKYGQPVKKGDLLATIDNRKQKQDLKSLYELYLKNQDLYQRQQKLNQESKGAYISKQTISDQKHLMLQSKANYLAAQVDLQQTEIKAPFNGIISDSLYTIGSYVDTNATIATLYNPTQITALYQLGQQYHGQVNIGQPVTVILANDKPVTAHISYISPDIDTASNGFNVRAKLAAATRNATSGMSIVIHQTLPQTKVRIVIPGVALLTDLTGFHVFIAKQGVAVEQSVTPGQRTGDQVAIIKGLSVGDQVITQGQQNLHDGSHIKIITQHTATGKL